MLVAIMKKFIKKLITNEHDKKWVLSFIEQVVTEEDNESLKQNIALE